MKGLCQPSDQPVKWVRPCLLLEWHSECKPAAAWRYVVNSIAISDSVHIAQPYFSNVTLHCLHGNNVLHHYRASLKKHKEKKECSLSCSFSSFKSRIMMMMLLSFSIVLFSSQHLSLSVFTQLTTNSQKKPVEIQYCIMHVCLSGIKMLPDNRSFIYSTGMLY